MANDKLAWQGIIMAVQPRIRLTRSFDQRYHTYLGYLLRVQGQLDGEQGEFLIGIGQAAQAKQQFQVGDRASGHSVPVAVPQMEPVEYYKTTGLKIEQRAAAAEQAPPPWQGVPPSLELYQERGHRRLSARTYSSKCNSCIWGCRMAVEMVVDHWNTQHKRYRSETFCYGPKSCPFYKAGPVRTVPGRHGMVWEEQDWVDEDATAHRALDE